MNNISKLGLGIIAFEGLEHIKNITYELRNLCDIIIICLQKYSYHGIEISQDDIDEAYLLKEFGYVDDVIWFEPHDKHANDDEKIVPRLIETDKRNFILDYLETNGCSHSIIIDSDEYYDHCDFKNAIELVDKENYKITYCQYLNYYRDYRHLLIWPFLCYVPFVASSKYRFNFKSSSFNKPSDPTRRYEIPLEDNTEFKILDFNVIKMHHLSWIRKDIAKKIDNWSAKKYFKNYNNLCKNILDRYYNYKDGQNAIIMFNVPYNNVAVDVLDKQYIHPKFTLNESIKQLDYNESSSIDNVSQC